METNIEGFTHETSMNFDLTIIVIIKIKMYTNKNTRELGFIPIKGQTASKGDLSNTGSRPWYNIPNKIFILYTKSKCCRNGCIR